MPSAARSSVELSKKKSKYLKKPRIPRFVHRLSRSGRMRRFGSSVAAMPREQKKSTSV